MDLINERRKDSGVEVADSGYSSSAQSSAAGVDYIRSLRSARLTAQERIESARTKPKFQIVAEDWTDAWMGQEKVVCTARHEFGGYIGMVGSQVTYDLTEDVEGRDEVGVEVGDLIDGGEGAGLQGLEGRGMCDGKWNARRGKEGKDMVSWEHREREKGRGRVLEVRRLFY